MTEAEKNPFEAVRTLMLENLEKVGGATQSYIDMVERTMRAFPGANEEQNRHLQGIHRAASCRQPRLLREAFARQGFSGRLPHSGRIFSVPVEGRRRGNDSDWRQDGWLVQTNGLSRGVSRFSICETELAA